MKASTRHAVAATRSRGRTLLRPCSSSSALYSVLSLSHRRQVAAATQGALKIYSVAASGIAAVSNVALAIAGGARGGPGAAQRRR